MGNSKWMNVNAAVTDSTAYDGKGASRTLVGRSIGVTLPAVNNATADIQAMGTMSVPVMGMLEDMELTITKIGVDKGISRLSKFESHDLEFRWVQNIVKKDGTTDTVGLKAYLRTMPVGIPQIGVALGEAGENELTHKVTKYQLFADNKELWCIDRLNQILRIDGKDYYKNIDDLL